VGVDGDASEERGPLEGRQGCRVQRKNKMNHKEVGLYRNVQERFKVVTDDQS
jgi:hypothetical protein